MEGKLLIYKGGTTCAFLCNNEFFSELDRLIIGTNRSRVEVMLALAKQFSNGFTLGYETVSDRGRVERGKYLSDTLSFDEIAEIMLQFRRLIEADARHHTFLFVAGTDNFFVLDEHDLIYAYGNLELHKSLLTQLGFIEKYFDLPFPHIHAYLDECDHEEAELASLMKLQDLD